MAASAHGSDRAGIGALSVAFAMFLILELARPNTGPYRVSPAALQQAIEFVDKHRDDAGHFRQLGFRTVWRAIGA